MPVRLLHFVTACLLIICCNRSLAQDATVCKPVNERTGEIGCWITADQPIGQLTKPSVFWHLDTYPSRAMAEADKGPHGVVLESLNKVWLLTIESRKWHSAHETSIAKIGPLAINAGENYTARYMEAIFTPGMTVAAHIHAGPEAWYTVAGETCLETSDGHVQVGRPGVPVIVPAGLSMHLTATGTEERRSLVLILYESSKRTTTFVHDWIPKGLCNSQKQKP